MEKECVFLTAVKILRKIFEVAQTESVNGFADDTMYIEKYIEDPRHIEFQILADKYGNVISLGERDCSIQRRHQKMVEESPSAALDDKLRAQMGEVAVRAAKAANYESAGTIEFLLDKNKKVLFHGNEYTNPGRASGNRDGNRSGSSQRADFYCSRRKASVEAERIFISPVMPLNVV